jgi:hypothetical protein
MASGRATDRRTGAPIIDVLDPTLLPPGYRTLRDLAKHYYGSYAAWRLIAVASGLQKMPPEQDLREALIGRLPAPKITIPEQPAGDRRQV